MKCEGELDCYSYTFNQVRTEHSQCVESHSSEPEFLLLNEISSVVEFFKIILCTWFDRFCMLLLDIVLKV